VRIRESLQITMRTGIWFELINILFHTAELCADTGRPAEALTAWAAHAAFARREGFLEGPDGGRRRESERKLRAVLGPAEAGAAQARGTAMSTATAAEYVLLLTAPARRAAGPDPGQLTAGERELVTLVAQGRTDAQIAAQLSVSVRTVSSRLGRIRDKTGCRRRADLTSLALRAGLV
jgi:DNA-binding CsgD family transcriptional regulator